MSSGGVQETITGLDVGPGPVATRAEPAPPPEGARVVRVLPDVLGIDKEFDYLVPDGAEVHVGDVVRIQLGARRVGGWITALDVAAPDGVRLVPLAKVSGRGPSADLVDLASWAAWRWAGRRANFLRAASPSAVVRSLPASEAGAAPAATATEASIEASSGSAVDPAATLVDRALELDRGVLRLPPGADRYRVVLAAARAPSPAAGGHTLVLCPSVAEARTLGQRLRRDGVRTAILAHDGPGGVAAAGEWARARAGAVVVGARAAAWAPMAPLGRVVVLDEHDEGYQEESSPTWHARDVVIERARRAGAPCLLVSPTPTLEVLGWGELLVPGRGAERAGWPRVEVVDQRELDPALGPLFSPALVNLVRGPGTVLCILNRTGRARLLACSACTTLARCAVCDAAVSQADPASGDDDESGLEPGLGLDPGRGGRGDADRAPDVGHGRPGAGRGAGATRSGSGRADAFACGRCGAERPMVCLSCGGARFKHLRLGVSRVREELEVLAGQPVGEVTGTSAEDDPVAQRCRILVGTEALLHRAPRADAVAFLDFDQELLAVRYRAAEQALALLARAARLVLRGGGEDARLVVQSRTPDHPVLMAARHSDPGRLTEGELPLRAALGLPPTTAMAILSGAAAPAFAEALGRPAGVTVQGPIDGAWRLRAADHRTLCDALATVARPPGRLRLEVDPLRA